MQSTWREAMAYAWGNFTGVMSEGSARVLRLLLFLVFIGGTAWAVYSYLELQQLRQEKTFTASVTPTSVNEDRKRLEDMIAEVRDASARRSGSAMTAQTMKDMGKYLFDDPSRRMAAVVPEIPLPGGGVVAPQVEEVVEPPPEITLRAIMVIDKTKTALIDIAGVGTGLLVKQGDTFLNREGRIVRITNDKVVVRWKKKTWNVTPGF